MINGDKISHYQFPTDKLLRQKWIHAIRRDVGPHFVIHERHTKVCSRHFKPTDFNKTLAGIRKLKKGAVQWKQESSPKRKPPKERRLASPKRHPTKYNGASLVNTTCDERETTCNYREIECQTDTTQCDLNKLFEDTLLYKDERPKLLENVETLQENTRELQEQISKLQEHIAALKGELKQKNEDCASLSQKLNCVIERCQESERKNEQVFGVDK